MGRVEEEANNQREGERGAQATSWTIDTDAGEEDLHQTGQSKEAAGLGGGGGGGAIVVVVAAAKFLLVWQHENESEDEKVEWDTQ
ncbi:hypothetical protein ColLi_05653 [Colletotrichum liriopes]|uniref:Uncharacterized protein n=1 Tax=Colletotrichum liriopes TaxID=708192 RepID=A0AA37GLH8_9PEZI|nr:hypothetical protein ColLi_05653 [Colletotrichum liriopes]